MAVHWQTFVLLLLHLHGNVFVNTSPIATEEKAENHDLYLYLKYRPEIWSVLDHLNLKQDRLYNYNFRHFVHAQKETDDITFIEIEVAAECFMYPGCPNAEFMCTAYVQYMANSKSFTALPGVDCQHKIEKQKNEEISISSVPLPLTKKSPYCLGCMIDLDTDVPGVQNLVTTALHHLKAEENAKNPVSVRVLRLQREIVAGVKFVLLLELKDVTDTEICRIEFLQRPWISNNKQIIANNCTISQIRSDVDNQIDVVKNKKLDKMPGDQTKENTTKGRNLVRQFMSLARLMHLESQIIPSIESVMGQKPVEIKFTKDNSVISEEGSKSFGSSGQRRKRQVSSDTTSSSVDSTTHIKLELRGAPKDSTNDPEMLNLAKQTLIQLDSKSSHDNKYKVVKLHTASKQVVSGMLYKLKLDIIESDCLKDEDKDSSLCGDKEEAVVKTCQISIWDQPWLPLGKKTEVTCDHQEQHSFRTRRSVTWGKYQSRTAFYAFKEKYLKHYMTPEEEDYRFEIFMNNMQKAREMQDHELGTAIYGATIFADMHLTEFKAYLGFRPELRQENAIPMAPAKIPDIELPTEFDWRTKDAVTHVKDQGMCGSCWAFSVTGNVEGQYAIKHKKLLVFSEQELVDCDSIDEGCNGGLMDNAYRAIEQLGGLELEKEYPYDGEMEHCKFKRSMTRVRVTGAVNVSQNEDDMAKFLVKNGPLSIALNAFAMQFYKGGVSHPTKQLCVPDTLDHGVLIVGYGVETSKQKNVLPYWIVKNSWGPTWGEQGYYRVYRGDNTCGVNKMVSSAIIA